MAKVGTKVSQGAQGAQRNFPKVRKALQGADFDLGILKKSRQTPWELPRCNRVFSIRPGLSQRFEMDGAVQVEMQ